MIEEYSVTMQQTADDGIINERTHESDLDLEFELASVILWRVERGFYRLMKY